MPPHQFPELTIRLRSFARSGHKMSKKGTRLHEYAGLKASLSTEGRLGRAARAVITSRRLAPAASATATAAVPKLQSKRSGRGLATPPRRRGRSETASDAGSVSETSTPQRPTGNVDGGMGSGMFTSFCEATATEWSPGQPSWAAMPPRDYNRVPAGQADSTSFEELATKQDIRELSDRLEQCMAQMTVLATRMLDSQ